MSDKVDRKSETDAEAGVREFMARSESERNQRLDKIAIMQSDLARKRLKYNLIFFITSLAATVFMVLIGMPLWVGILFFVGIFLALRSFYLPRLLENKYNEHVDGLYKYKDKQ